jgi:hypothetical protein
MNDDSSAMVQTVPIRAPSRAPRWRRRWRLWILVGGLITLFIIRTAIDLNPELLSDRAAGLPLDRCLTEQAVREFLDGKNVALIGSTGAVNIVLRKERISSLRIRSDDFNSISLRFKLDHRGKRYQVEGSFDFTTSDSPSLHYHGWDHFQGWVVST